MTEVKSKPKSTDQKILKMLRNWPERAFTERDIADHLKIPRNSLKQFKMALYKLVEQREVVVAKKGRYQLPKKSKATEGKLSVNQKGFGFVITDPEVPDVFIGRRQMGSAVNGDTVRVRVHKGGKVDSPRGSVTKVVERGSDKFIGTVFVEDRVDKLAIQPLTPSRGIRILSGKSIEYRSGLTVVAKVKDWGSDLSPIQVEVVEIIGEAGDPANDLKIILSRYGYVTEFPPKVARQAAGFDEKYIKDEISRRLDLRDWLTFTIDPASARDFDDALSIDKTEKGYRLGVHIADVSHFVRPGTDLDREAINRATSVYFSEGVVHMLPEELSADLCSLRPNCDRLTVSAIIDLNNDLRITRFVVKPAVINSNYRLTYQEVQDSLDGKTDLPIDNEIKFLLKLSRDLFIQRTGWGSIDFDIPEPVFTMSEEGIPHSITQSERLDSHRIVEECMLLANRLVAERVPGKKDSRKPFIYRIHDKPEEPDVERLVALLTQLKIFPNLKSGGLSPAELRDIIAGVADSPYKYLVENIALRTMTKALYSSDNRGHFGLAFRNYTHFTSPIRRYPDLLVHRLIKQYGGFDDKGADHATSIHKVAEQTIDAELKALQAEREYVKVKQLRWLQEHVGETFEGLISGVIQFGIFVELADTMVEGLVHVDTLEDDDFVYDPDLYRLHGRRSGKEFRLGGIVKIKVQEVLLDKLRANFVLSE